MKEAAARLGFEEHATSWQEVLARKDIDVVDICTPGDSHAPIAVAAAEAGKAILCEKPLANTVADAERMHAAVKKAGVVNMVCHNYRRCPAVALAKQIIDDGQIGDIHHYRGALPAGLDRRSRSSRASGGWRRRGPGRDRWATSCRTRWICRGTWSASRSRSRAC